MSFWDEEHGYDVRSPKHPYYTGGLVAYVDLVRKARRESGLPPLTDRDPGDECDTCKEES